MTTPIETAAYELRAYYGCAELEQATGLRVVPAYDEHGRPTGRVAIDPDDFRDWLDDYTADLFQGDDD